MYLNRDPVYQSIYLSIDRYALMYLDQRTICPLTDMVCMSMEIMYVDRHIIDAWQLRYHMSMDRCAQL